MRIIIILIVTILLPFTGATQWKQIPASGNKRVVNADAVSPIKGAGERGRSLVRVQDAPTRTMEGAWLEISGKKVFFTEQERSSTTRWLYASVPSVKDAELSSSVLVSDFTHWVSQIYACDDISTTLVDEVRDGSSNFHMKFQLRMVGVPVHKGESILHVRGNDWTLQLPLLENLAAPAIGPAIDRSSLELRAKNVLSDVTVWTDRGPVWDQLGMDRMSSTMVLRKRTEKDEWGYFYEIHCHPNLKEGWTLYLDAVTGEVVDKFKFSCHLFDPLAIGNRAEDPICGRGEESISHLTISVGPEEANAVDLLGQTRRLRVYQERGLFYLLDASRPMFNAQRSVIPDDPVGTIWTIDAAGTSPMRNDFSVRQVSSTNNVWSDRGSVSAHYNGARAFEYFSNTFSRNSINGSGGNIISLINVGEEDGGGLDNAFWNGAAIFYGNGRDAFLPLARGLDVAGHEMSHGVIQHTANLEYQGESGAMNEAFADIFGAMVDRDDWQIGEDVVRRSFFPSGALRDMADPHNGGSRLGDPGWQPRHYSERYQGSEDNGGVHINSGIVNHAYYLFAEEVGRTKAERIYYHALVNYLTKSSQFKDLRVAVDASIRDLFGSNDPALGASARAFDRVGITGGGSGGNQQEKLPVNPGDDLIVFTTSDYRNLYVGAINGQLIFDPLSFTDPLSHPSVTDDGSAVVFVGTDGHIHVVYIDWNTVRILGEEIISADPIWRNVAVAKDGSLIAALTDDVDNIIHVFGDRTYQPFELYNPTFTQGVTTGDVLFADALEFDYTGEYILYDAFNRLPQTLGEGIEYWDIGFLHAWDQDAFVPGSGEIAKLFSALPEGISVGNPGFAKNSPFAICFDQVEESFLGDDYFIRSANLETNQLGLLFQNAVVGYPNFSRTDEYVIFNARSNQGNDVIGYVPVMENLTEPAGNPAVLFENLAWGVWFSNGVRDLQTSAEQLSIHDIMAYPNPVDGELFLDADWGLASDQLTVRIIDVTGKELMSIELEEPRGAVRIDMEDLSPGYYLVLVNGKKGNIYRQRIIKQ